jgi:SNF2 family DNA or RNA helicase
MAIKKTYGKIYLSDNRWIIPEAEPHVIMRLKSVFRRVPTHLPPPYHFENTSEQCADLQWFMQRYPLDISEEDLAIMIGKQESFFALQSEMERILKPDFIPHTYSLREGQQLRHYQAQAIELVRRSRSLLLGDDIGLGKTYAGIGTFVDTGFLPAVVVVKTHLWKQWETKISEFSNLTTHVIHGRTPYSLPAADVYIIKYTCLAAWTDVFRSIGVRACAFDEVQELRRGNASYKGCAAATLVQQTELALGLTATVVYNYADEVFHIMDILKPGCLGSKDEFIREWTTDGRVVRDPEALGTYLRERYLFLRRRKVDVGQYLGPVNKIIETVDFDEDAVKDAEKIAVQLAIRASTGSFIERGKAARELDLRVRHFTGVSKASYVAEYVKVLLESGEPIVLSGWHRDVYDIWAKHFIEYQPAWYTGTESGTQKEKSKQRFINGDTPLMIISNRSGEGLDDLQYRSSINVVGELDFSPGIHDQLAGRLDREGQKNPPVTQIFLVSNSGSDPLLVNILGLKSSQARGINDPGMGPQTVQSDQTRIKMLIEKYLNKKGIRIPARDEQPELVAV